MTTWYKKMYQGSALLSALFIMTLVAIAATAMSLRISMDIYRTRLTILSDQLYLSSQLISFWSISKLIHERTLPVFAGRDLLFSFPLTIHSSDPNISLQGNIYDLQSRFNINNLIEKKNIPGFIILLKQVAHLNQEQAKKIAEATHHWITEFNFNEGQNQYTNYYLKQNPAYYPGYQLLQNISEFRLIMGVTSQIYQNLLPYITALPQKTLININTASPSVLMTLGLDENKVNQIISSRGKEGFKPGTELNELLNELHLSFNSITLESQYFMSIGRVRHPDLNLNTVVILERVKQKNQKIAVR